LLSLGEENVVGVPGAGLGKVEWADKISKVRTKYIVFDNDAAGREGADNFIASIGGSGCTNIDLGRLVKATGTEGKDITDWVNTGKTLEDFKALLAAGKRMLSPLSLKTMTTVKQVRDTK